MFDALFKKLLIIERLSENVKENWVNITFEGAYKPQIKSAFAELASEIERLSLQSSLLYFIGNTPKQNVQEFIDDIQPNESWKITINKNVLLGISTNGIINNFFYLRSELIKWIRSSDPFSEIYPLNSSKFRIVVNGYNNVFGGPNFVVCGNNFDFPDLLWDQYDENLIVENVHIISKSRFLIRPLKQFVSFGEVDDISIYFFQKSILVLLSGLCNEIYDTGNIILKGFRRISLDIGLEYNGIEITADYQNKLAAAVQWIYQKTERSDLRLKLILERITLDVDYSLPYIQGLFSVIEDATIQAKERYSFIIYERKDLYQKELKDLLKDIKTLTDTFSSKVRSLLSNLLRDVLAAFVLVGVTLFSKVTEIDKLFENKLIKYVFLAFGVYFIFSALIQLIIDAFDLIRSNKEFDYWKNVTREYMSKEDFKKHRKRTLGTRLLGSWILYITILFLYLSVGIFCIYMPEIWPVIIK